MYFLLRFLSFIPTRLLSAIGWLIGWLTFLFSASYRRNFLDHARKAGFDFPDVRPAIGQAGRMATDLPKVWVGNLANVQIEEKSLQRLYAARQSGQGILFLTPHLGCFEASSQKVAQLFGSSRGPFVVLYRPSRNRWLAQRMQTIRNRNGQKAVPTDLSGVRAMLKTLRQGGSVGMLPDQVPPYGMGIWSEVFGQPAYTMTIAARLIKQVSPIVLIARCERRGMGGGYWLNLEMFDYQPEQTESALVLQISQAIEDQIKACPEQYLWGYPRFKHPRGMPANEVVDEREV